jgi:hypothetical protein
VQLNNPQYINKMILEEKQRKEFEEVVKPVIKWLAENFHPHVKMIIDHDSAELLESSGTVVTEEYIRD